MTVQLMQNPLHKHLVSSIIQADWNVNMVGTSARELLSQQHTDAQQQAFKQHGDY
jgi:hypothetical protein